MATETLSHPVKYDEFTGERTVQVREKRPVHWLTQAVHALASLKFTVTLMALGVFIVLVGTLAQAKEGMWEVLDRYFSSYFLWINIQVFFPPSFFPEFHKLIPRIHFPFVGGATIGLAMIVNLLAAHTLRFKVQAKGARLIAGLTLTAVGVAFTWLIIALGHNPDGVQGQPFFAWAQFWTALKLLLLGIWFAMWYPLVRLLREKERFLEAVLLSAAINGLAVLLVWIYSSDVQLGAPTLRVMWQLIQGLIAGLLLFAGCWFLFRKRAGIVQLHAGILLMMFGQYVATVYNIEERMQLHEGETKNYGEDIRTAELAVIDTSAPDHHDVVVIPQPLLERSLRKNTVISDQRLPFDIRVVDFYKNSSVYVAQPGQKLISTAGIGKQYVARELPVNSGADSEGTVDMPAAYIELLAKDGDTGKSIGTHLVAVSKWMAMRYADPVDVNGKTYHVALRFKRNYKDYAVKLVDVVREDYDGTDTPRNFASVVQIFDDKKNIDHESKIWMNNPLRFAGDTFYQSRYEMAWDPVRRAAIEVSEFQVVRNNGWMIPYVACMIVAVGLVAHFWGTLIRFLVRREREIFNAANPENPYEAVVVEANNRKHKAKSRGHKQVAQPSGPKWISWAIPLAALAMGVVWLLYPIATWKPTDERGMKIGEFGELPVLYEGRTKPIDTVARNALRLVSNKDSFKDAAGNRQPAIKWFMDVVSGSPEGNKHRVIRIDYSEVLDSLGLERRKGLRYSINDLLPHFDTLQKQVELAAKASQDESQPLTLYQKKILELHRRLQVYIELSTAFRTPPNVPVEVPSAEKLASDRALLVNIAMSLEEPLRMKSNSEPDVQAQVNRLPRMIPNAQGEWEVPTLAWAEAYRVKLLKEMQPEAEPTAVPNEGALLYHQMMKAYAEEDKAVFNQTLAEFQQFVHQANAEQYYPKTHRFEAFYNRLAPFATSQFAYVGAFALAALGWLGWSRPLNRASFWLIVITLLVHSFAIGARIAISGKPPVTNLYSSAVFIGWAGALCGICIEVLYRFGVGNILASICGFATLLIASQLANGGETMPALLAVLDTQFWLSTHVVVVALGYMATFIAGGIGVMYILMGLFTRSLDANMSRSLIRMMYGTLCFALLFSFVGTVLGGLWADDSWGRFWGWDPKENGALIIVLWNALVLHARWDRIVSDRGFAALAVAGNIATAWSWFGVNELGVGLHSYGFTEGVIRNLALFVLSQLIVIGLSFVPYSKWRGRPTMTAAETV